MDSTILDALIKYTKDPKASALKLKGDASSREYYRDLKNNLIICNYHNDQKGFHNFTELQSILKDSNILVPKVLDEKFPILIQEDLGDKSLEMEPTPENYSKVVNILIGFQSLPTDFSFKINEMQFTKEKFMWELNFAVEHLQKLIPSTNEFALDDEFDSICDFILKTPQCPCHRDFHSN